MKINNDLTAKDLLPGIRTLWQASATKIHSIEKSCRPGTGAPVFTVRGKYTARGWTEWTQGFQYGSAILQFDATGDDAFLRIGRDRTIHVMASHVTHIGVHDHGFNNVSTYGNLRRLMLEKRIAHDQRELEFYELALKCTGAVQAARWSEVEGGGYIHSFNGPHSLFADTMRTLRALSLAHALGHVLMGENDRRHSLLERMVTHAATNAHYNVYYGEGRDHYDLRGRVAHESIFNMTDGAYRCPSSQQGYSPFSTWTRGQAWVLLGYAEQLEFLATLDDVELKPCGGRKAVETMMRRAGEATCDFWIERTPVDGVPYWDTGAPGLEKLGDWVHAPSDPFNQHEPVDSSAAAIACQGLMRLGRLYQQRGKQALGKRYWQAGLTVLDALLREPYLSTDVRHQGLLLHTIYHRPRGWDHVPRGSGVPNNESCMWGDYHLREAALYVQRIATGKPSYTFFGPASARSKAQPKESR